MNKHERRVAQVYRQGRDFIEKHADLIGPAEVGPALQLLDTALAGVHADTEYKIRSRNDAKSDTLAKRQLRARLRNLMGPISAIATGRLVGVPVAEMVAYTLPAATVSDDTLIGSARAMASAAANHREEFQARGRPDGFVETLRATADALAARIESRDGNRVSGNAARLSIAEKLRTARRTLGVLTRVVVDRLHDHPDLIENWRGAIRIGGYSTPDEGQASADGAAPGTEVAADGVAPVANRESKAA